MLYQDIIRLNNTDLYVQMYVTKQDVKPTITVPPAGKSNSSSVTKADKPKRQPVQAAQGSVFKTSTGFHWTELDIPFECPASDCTHSVPPDLPLLLITRFRQRSKAIYDFGEKAPDVLRLETRICIEIGGVRIRDRARHFAKANGYADLNLVAVPERILRWELDLLLLVSDEKHRDSCYSWTNLLDELKSGGSSLEALEKGKSIPYEVTEQSRPG
jgi:hypothetical protein